MGKAFVVVGTDTGAGKTIVSAGLLLSYRSAGVDVGIQKWVSTGDPFGFSQDVDYALAVAGLTRRFFPGITDRHLNPFSFVYPASPHYSAEVHRKEVKIPEIKRLFKDYSSLMEVLIVEGVGGLAVPLTEKVLLIDLIKELDLPVVLVVKNVLGAINHSLLSIEALKGRGIKIIGLVFNDGFGCNMDIKKENIRIITKLGKVRSLGRIPFMENIRDYKVVFDEIRKEIDRRLQ